MPARHMTLTATATLLLGAFGSIDHALASAGQFRFATGEVQLQRQDGSRIGAFKGLTVEEGDTILTGPRGQAQLVMTDQGIIAVRPDTRLKIETYRYAGKPDGSELGVMNLIKGAFRTITGAIGRVNKDSYKVRTPTATIGIRGTDHEPAYVPPPAPGETPIAPPGTYNKVNVGETYIETSGGRLELGANQIGFAAATPGAHPMRLPEAPAFLRATPAPGKEARERHNGPAEGSGRPRAPGNGAPQPPQPTGTAANGQPLPPPPPAPTLPGMDLAGTGTFLPPPPALLPPPDAGTLDPRNLPPNTFPAPLLTAAVGGDLSPTIMGSGAGIVGSDFGILLDAAGLPLQIGSSTFNYNRNGAPLVDQGSAAVAGLPSPVRWGIYEGGEIKDNMGVRTPLFFHFMAGPDATPAPNVLAAVTPNPITFSQVGGFTKPVTETGAVGGSVTFASITLSSLSGAPVVTGYNLGVTDALARNWSVHMGKFDPITSTVQPVSAVPLGEFIKGTGVPLVDTACSTTFCSPGAATGQAHGIPIGASAPVGVVSSYDLHKGPTGVTGSVLITP